MLLLGHFKKNSLLKKTHLRVRDLSVNLLAVDEFEPVARVNVTLPTSWHLFWIEPRDWLFVFTPLSNSKHSEPANIFKNAIVVVLFDRRYRLAGTNSLNL